MMRHFRKKLKRTLLHVAKKSGVGFLTLLTVFYSFGGLDIYLGLTTPFAPKRADAAYTGKHLRTVEFALGGGVGTAAAQTGTDNNGVARASDANVYAGSAWNATKGTAGTKTIQIPGSGIRVISAYLDVTATLVTGVDVTDLEFAFDATPGPSSGQDVAVGAVARNGATLLYIDSSLSSPILSAKASVTSLLQGQSDAEWNTGVDVVGMMSVVGPTWHLATMKLIITYEQDYSLSAHDELKTVRYPLRSTTAGDSGTKRSDCAIAANCDFTYALDLPDLQNTADIVDAWFEISYVGAGVDSMTPSIIGGAAGTAHNSIEALADRAERFLIYRPAIGGANLGTSTQTLRITDAVAAVGGLGGEVVVTYKYSTGAATQVETVQYWMGQYQATIPTPLLPGTASSSFSQQVTITNGSRDPRAIWFKVHDSITNAPTFDITAKIGASATNSVRYTTTSANARAGEMRIIHDMGSATTSWSGATTQLSADLRHTANTWDGPPGVEAYITFHWAGGSNGAVTQTGKFFAGSSGAVPALNGSDNSIPFSVTLPEVVTKTYRSAYLSTSVIHTDVTAIIPGLIRISLASTSAATMMEGDEDTEGFRAIYVTQATTTDFTPAAIIPWTTRAFQLNVRWSTSTAETEEVAVNSEMIVTYDVDFSENDPLPVQKHLRTVEFALGSGAGTAATQTGTDNNGVARASDANVYAGSAWNATKGTAGKKTLQIPGSGIRVISAYLDVTATLVTAANVSDLELAFDATPGPSPGEDVAVGAVARNGVANIYISQSGISPPILSAKASVTSLLQGQTDSEWNTGVDVVGMLSIVGPTWHLATMKLIVTYEEDFSLVPHTELKTVRYPLRSTVAGDSGTKRSNCAVGNCDFTYALDLPDLQNTADIVDAWFEISYVEDGAANVTPLIVGGSAGTVHNPLDAIADNQERFIVYRPAIGGVNLGTSTQTLRITDGVSAIGGLGGEVVVTYKYSTGAATQVETVQYWMGQQEALPGTASSSFSKSITITNGGRDPRAIWFKIHDSITLTPSLGITTKVGASASSTILYTPTSAQVRAGELRVIQDVGSATTSWSGSATTLQVDARHSVNTMDGPPGIEVYITFRWAGGLNGPVTQTGKFYAGSSGAVPALPFSDNSIPFSVTLPEIVTKTYRSAYLSTSVIHSDATSIAPSPVRISLASSSAFTITEGDNDIESFRAIYVTQATTTNFTPDATIPWATRAFQLNVRGQNNNAQTEEYAVNSEMIVTYDAALELKVPTFTQSHFRFYVDNDALLPTTAWPALGGGTLGEDTGMTMADSPLRNGSSTRIRMSYTVATTTLTAGAQQFRLQYAPKVSACDAVSSWFAIGAAGSGTIWRGVAGTPVDGTALSGDPPTPGDLVLSLSDTAGTYEEANDTAVNPFAVLVDNDAEYDWNIENNGAATSTTYCFRMVKNDDSPFWSYTYYPEVSTEGYEARTDTWRFYDDETNEKPTVALAGTNTAPINIADGSIMKLRLSVREANGENGVAQKFKVQYSTFSDFSSGVNDVVATSSCLATSGWCYGDGIDNDNDPILSRVLLGSTTANGTHNEGTSTTTFGPIASTATEFEYTLARSGGSSNTTYYFRLYDLNHSRPVPLYSGASYPSLSTDGTELIVIISGVATSTVTEGITTTVGTAPSTVPFGTIAIGASSTAAHRIDVTTNATEGYQVLLKSNAAMLSNNGATIPDVTGTNASPAPWATGCTPGMSGCWGYHSGDDLLSSGSTRFLSNNTFAQFATTTSQEVIYNSGPVTSEVTDMVYTTEIHQLQAAGSYTAQLQYIIVPIF